jgi:hypothetical protein
MSKASVIRNAAVQTYDNRVTFLSAQLNKAPGVVFRVPNNQLN